MGKFHQLPSHSSLNSYTQLLQLVFCDLWDPSHIKSSMGYNYYVSFVDAYSRYTWIYFLKHKPKTIHVFKQFKVLLNFNWITKLKKFKQIGMVNLDLSLIISHPLVFITVLYVLILTIKMVYSNANIVTLWKWVLHFYPKLLFLCLFGTMLSTLSFISSIAFPHLLLLIMSHISLCFTKKLIIISSKFLVVLIFHTHVLIIQKNYSLGP